MAHRLEQENWKRLNHVPARFGYPLPPTEWFFVEFLRSCHLDELHTMGRCGWDDPGDLNEVLKVALRWTELLTIPQTWEPMPILWGHTRQGPFTILDGNHRIVACAMPKLGAPDFQARVCVGLSPTPFFFHRLDPF